MNLWAYKNIKKLQPIAEENGIEIPRLRGYLLMKKEDKYSNSEIEALIKSERDYVYEISFISTNDKKEMMRAVKNADALVRKKRRHLTSMLAKMSSTFTQGLAEKIG